MPPRSQTTSPLSFGWFWAAAAILASAALIAEYGIGTRPDQALILRITLIAAMALFAVSRITLFFPASEWMGRFSRWWMDFLLLAAGVVWWAIDPRKEPIVLRVAAIYIVALGVGTLMKACVSGLLDRIATGRPMFWRLIGLMLACSVVGGGVLALPACCTAVTGQKLEQYAMHALNCWFTAASAITCTGLSTLDIGDYFTFPGQLTILILLQAGGMLAVILGTVWVLRGLGLFRGSPTAREEIVGAIRWSITAMILLEVAGAAVLYSMWDSASDVVFARMSLPPLGGIDPGRAFFGLFHSVSALCNGGFALPRDGMVLYAWKWPVYIGLLPLMLIGSIGAPALRDLCRHLRNRPGSSLSEATRVTLWGSLALSLIGATLLFAVESTQHWQLRYPRGNTPGKLLTMEDLAASRLAASDEGPRKLAQLDRGHRAATSVFISAAARTTGFKVVRFDESSLAPSARWLLMLLMVIGGGVGGTAGGVRIVAAWQTARGVFRAGHEERDSHSRMIAAMLLLIAVTTLVLLYRDVGSFEASLFEAVSACCNVGFTTGLTSQIYVEARVALILAMIVGRAVPLALWSTRTS